MVGGRYGVRMLRQSHHDDDVNRDGDAVTAAAAAAAAKVGEVEVREVMQESR